VRNELEACGEQRTEPRRDEHEADLRDRRPGEDPSHITLRDSDERRSECGAAADDRRGLQHVGHQDRPQPHEEHDAAGDGHGLQQRRHGRRRLRRFREPAMQRRLRGLRESADQEQHARHCGRTAGRASVFDRRAAQLREVDGMELGQEDECAGEERGVPDPLDDERCHRCAGRRPVIAVMSDEQVRGDAGELPPREEEQKVRREDDEQHPGDEQRERREVALQPAVAREVADRVERDECRDAGHGERDREHRAIDHERDVGAGDGQPRRDERVDAGPVP